MAESSNLAAVETWSVAIDLMIKNGVEAAEKGVRAIVLDMAATVIERSPVDTGYFRSHWSVLIGIPPVLTPEKRVKIEAGKTEAFGSPLASIVPQLAGVTLNGPTQIWVVNPTIYGPALEHGHSQQAPHGMVGLTLIEMQAKYGGVLR